MPGGAGPKTVKGAQSDPNYVSRLLLDCVPVFHRIITPARGGGKNYAYSYATGPTVTDIAWCVYLHVTVASGAARGKGGSFPPMGGRPKIM